MHSSLRPTRSLPDSLVICASSRRIFQKKFLIRRFVRAATKRRGLCLGKWFDMWKKSYVLLLSPKLSARAHAALKKCLNKHYEDLLFRLVFQQALRLDFQRLEILRLYYIRHDTRENEAQIARALKRTESEVNNGLATGRQELAAAIANWIQNRLNVPPDSDSLNPLTDKITSLVEEWLPAICTISLTCHN